MGAAASAAAVAVPPVPTTADTPQSADSNVWARGRVVERVAGSGGQAPVGEGIAGVMVSNGCDVAVTDSDGRWQLPITSGEHLFVVTPSGWTSSQAAAGNALSSYLFQPEGSPTDMARRHPGVAPTGRLPSSIDFSLRRSPQSPQFEVLLLADTQPGNDTELSYVRDAILAGLPGTGAAFALHHGDVVGDALDLFQRYRRLLDSTGMAWHHCPGNHDLNLDSPDPRFALETWKHVFGPPHYAFQHGQATFILLNNVDYFGANGPSHQGRSYRGLIGERQLRFVANILRHTPKDHLVVVSMHIPLVNHDDPGSAADTTADCKQLLGLLAGHPHSVSFSGHSHTTEHHYLGVEHGFARSDPHHHHVLTAACGSWWSGPQDHRGIPVSLSRDGSPKGYHVLSIDGHRYTTRIVAADAEHPVPSQLRLMVGARKQQDAAGRWTLCAQVPRTALASAYVFVDVFDGGPRTDVKLSVDGAFPAEVTMQRTSAPSPIAEEFFARHAALCKPWVEASSSSHLWTLPLPDTLKAGVHRICARARDQHGREHTSHLILEVTA